MVDAGVAGTGKAVVPGAGSALDLTRGAGVDRRNGCGWLMAILKKKFAVVIFHYPFGN